MALWESLLMQIGFVGTGTIAKAMIIGLHTLGAAPTTMVSPRSETVSRELASRFAGVRRTATNAEAATADIVVLGMRPTQVDEALTGIAFAPQQIVISLVAGLHLDELQKLAPLSRVDRAVPLPGIAHGEGPITVYPGLSETVALLRPLGDLLVARSEAALSMGGLSSFMSSYFELQNKLIRQAATSGATETEARAYVVSLLSMLAGTARRTAPEDFGELVAEHQTKGGLNERVREKLLAEGWFDMPAAAFDAIAGLGREKLG